MYFARVIHQRGCQMKMELVIGSRNAKKIGEIVDLLTPFGIAVKGVAEFSEAGEVEETGSTFAENAALKATQTAQALNRWVLAEDSGIMVDALKGAPGIYSARYSGPQATDDSNNQKLIRELADVADSKRGAKYVCHVVLADPDGVVRLAVEASCRGRIGHEPRGTNGFGYDPYFVIPEFHRTFGELGAIVKRHLSHRARAFHRLMPQLVNVLRDASPDYS
jgi:XTP/dITP diphosphohydrolase